MFPTEMASTQLRTEVGQVSFPEDVSTRMPPPSVHVGHQHSGNSCGVLGSPNSVCSFAAYSGYDSPPKDGTGTGLVPTLMHAQSGAFTAAGVAQNCTFSLEQAPVAWVFPTPHAVVQAALKFPSRNPEH